MDQVEIEEMFSALGEVKIRRMFGGKGVYHRGLIIAVEAQGEILLKADAVSAPQFEAAGARRWAYEGRAGKAVLMPYWSIPDDARDDPEAMGHWARLAYSGGASVARQTTLAIRPGVGSPETEIDGASTRPYAKRATARGRWRACFDTKSAPERRRRRSRPRRVIRRRP